MKFIFLICLFADAIANAGARGNDGGGGMGVLCVNDGVKTVESLDLYEAKNVWGYDIPQEDFKTSAKRVGFRYWVSLYEQPDAEPIRNEEGFARQTENFYNDHLVKKMNFIPPGSRLRSTEDATIILDPPPNCKLVQILVYLDEGSETGKIIADKEYWDLLDGQNKLSFYFHESMYKDYRRPGIERNSDAIRKWVAALFSSSKFPSRNGAVRKSKTALRCRTMPESPYRFGANFFVTPIEGPTDDNKRTNLYFQYLGSFGLMRAPLEYKAQVTTPFDSFRGIDPTPEYLGSSFTSFSVNSIVGGVEIAIIAERTCNTGNCIHLYLAQRLDDGRMYKEEIQCSKIDVIPE